MSETGYRIALGMVVLSAMSISAYFRARARRAGEVIARSRETPLLVAGRIIFGLPLFLTLLLYFVQPRWLDWSRIALPAAVRTVGLLLAALCVPLMYWVVSSLGSNISETVLTKRNHQLVTHGPYRYVRHPLYAVAILLFSAAAVVMASWFMALLVVLIALLMQLVVIPREEALLTEKFGDAYRRYGRGTGRLLPWLRRTRTHP
jgi:protein-S-isoprenylcysteine O-methyltransferase Ste14